MNKWIWIGIGATVLVGGTIAGVLIYRKKRADAIVGGTGSSSGYIDESVAPIVDASVTAPTEDKTFIDAIARITLLKSGVANAGIIQLAKQLNMRPIDIIIEKQFEIGAIPKTVDRAALKAQF